MKASIVAPSILAIETATDACSVAVCTPNATSSKCIVEPQAHAKLILGMIEDVCNNVGISLPMLDALAFGRGPGSFTGVRIAASVIQGLALGLQKPVIAISSLQALAQQAANQNKVEEILALIDARMHETYWGLFKVTASGLVSSKVPDSLEKPEDLQGLDHLRGIVVGTGAQAYKSILLKANSQLNIVDEIQYPRAEEVLQLAMHKFLAGETMAGHAAVPSYVRNDVAQKSKKNPD